MSRRSKSCYNFSTTNKAFPKSGLFQAVFSYLKWQFSVAMKGLETKSVSASPVPEQ